MRNLNTYNIKVLKINALMFCHTSKHVIVCVKKSDAFIPLAQIIPSPFLSSPRPFKIPLALWRGVRGEAWVRGEAFKKTNRPLFTEEAIQSQ